MNRRALVLLLALIAVIAILSACGGDDNKSTSSPTGSVTASSTVAITPNANCPAPSGDAPAPTMKQYTEAPSADTIDPSNTYIATVKTVRGGFTIKLRPDLAPKHVASFVFLANDHFFDGLTFHRVIPGFVAQTGDPTGQGSGGPGYSIPAEFTTAVKYARGTVGMARALDPNSAGSQWFVSYGPASNLDGQYTIFGEVTGGMEVVDCLSPRDVQKGTGADVGDKIISITVVVS